MYAEYVIYSYYPYLHITIILYVKTNHIEIRFLENKFTARVGYYKNVLYLTENHQNDLCYLTI